MKTSNPNSGQIQDLKVNGQYLYEYVGGLVSQWGEEMIGEYGFSKVGAVVGATYKEQGIQLRKQMPPYLLPGAGLRSAGSYG